MEQYKIDRINELARKNKAQGLTPDELAERDALQPGPLQPRLHVPLGAALHHAEELLLPVVEVAAGAHPVPELPVGPHL